MPEKMLVSLCQHSCQVVLTSPFESITHAEKDGNCLNMPDKSCASRKNCKSQVGPTSISGESGRERRGKSGRRRKAAPTRRARAGPTRARGATWRWQLHGKCRLAGDLLGFELAVEGFE